MEIFLIRRKWVISVVPLIFVLLFAFTFIPHKVLNIKADEISKITVFDGNTGYQSEITNKEDIYHIINNLNEITFQKNKPSFGAMGYSFRMTIYDDKGKSTKKFTINSHDTIKYKGFFYYSEDNSIDYHFIEKLVHK